MRAHSIIVLSGLIAASFSTVGSLEGCDGGGDSDADSDSDSDSDSDADSDSDTDTDTDADADCTSCHAFPPSTGRHSLHVDDEGYSCSRCHSDTVDSSDALISGGPHNDGENDVVFSGGGTWDGSSCSGIDCHGSESW